MGVGVSSLRSKRLRTKKRKVLIRKITIVLGLLVFLFVGSAVLSRSDYAKVKNVYIVGNKTVDVREIEEIINQKLRSSYLWFVSKDNVALYPRRAVEREILDRSRAIVAASVYFSDLHTIAVELKEHEPAYLWCDSPARAKCYFMNSHGYIFSESADFAENILFTYYGLIDPDQPIGQGFLSEDQFVEVNNFVSGVESIGFETISLNAISQNDFEVGTATGGRIIFSNRENPSVTLGNLEAFISEKVRHERDFISKIDHLDARFGSKLFLKLKD